MSCCWPQPPTPEGPCEAIICEAFCALSQEQQKQKKEAESAAAAEKEAAKAAGKEKGGTPKKQSGSSAQKEKDADPDGEQLAKVAEPLAEAVKLVRMLKEHSGDRLQTHVLAFEVCPSAR